ncbi:MAG TPA: hypothetical protein VFU03_01575 [Gemmatimonadales bacterium]|nr:hypothetical protein [Gemmatimonadales bacterium]
MFIELTDHLRCPAPHDEAFLVLVPYEMDGRMVVRGVLGCPICQREFRINRGVAVFELSGRTGEAAPALTTSVEPDAIVAFLGLEGPGGYLGLFGGAGGFAAGLEAALPGVHLVALNPPEGWTSSPSVSVLRGPMAPIKSRSFRGVVLGGDIGSNPEWQKEAARCVLPGLRVVGEGTPPRLRELESLGEAGGWWVSRKGQ